ncbi:hypothetical protein [Sorangium sp. So ce1099]|uniref:hypothetical protein n=1 Tax=Sorangium sp. So ce1099 TaxID=3133331 RepID=UPI003F5F0C1F
MRAAALRPARAAAAMRSIERARDDLRARPTARRDAGDLLARPTARRDAGDLLARTRAQLPRYVV